MPAACLLRFGRGPDYPQDGRGAGEISGQGFKEANWQGGPMKSDPLSSKECAERLKALADEDRLHIVQILRSGPKNVSEIAAELKEDITNVSHHLQILKREDIVETEKQGRFVVYRLHPDVFAATRSSADCLDFGCCKLELPK